MRLAPRVARLERHHGLHGPDRRDPETVRLHEEARTHAEMRQATRQLAAHMWRAAGQPERAAAVLGGGGSPADALGEEGTCLLLMEEVDRGKRLLDRAKALRKGKSTAFEQHYEGLFYFFHEQPDRAYPLLEASSYELIYRWDAIKLLCVILVEKNQVADATQFMAPFAQVEVKECDHAYVLAWLKLVDGKKLEARALLDQFPSDKLAEFWKPRFQKLRAKTQTLAS